MKNKIIKLHIDFIHYDVFLVFTDNKEKFRNEILIKKHPNIGKYNSYFYALCTSMPFFSYCIFPHRVRKSTIIHELTHTVDYIIEDRGFEGTEIRAYLLQYLIEEAERKLKKK